MIGDEMIDDLTRKTPRGFEGFRSEAEDLARGSPGSSDDLQGVSQRLPLSTTTTIRRYYPLRLSLPSLLRLPLLLLGTKPALRGRAKPALCGTGPPRPPLCGAGRASVGGA